MGGFIKLVDKNNGQTVKRLTVNGRAVKFFFWGFHRRKKMLKKPQIDRIFTDSSSVFKDFIEGEENYDPKLKYCFDEDNIRDIGYDLHMSQRYGLERAGKGHLQDSCVPSLFFLPSSQFRAHFLL